MTLDPELERQLTVLEIPSTLYAAKKPEELILQELHRCGYGEDATFAIKLALEEAMTNAVNHGNGNDKTKQITVRYCVTHQQTVILVRDQGSGFQPDHVPDPTSPGRLSLPHGRGLMLMRAYMSEVSYRSGGAEVCLIKKRDE